ncbi:hypothetical protein E4T56_gene5577 [Termitomyces sp. T112]|nr:hypothetical protein E4T56_gene5577 [Termitomyces sp. T112]
MILMCLGVDVLQPWKSKHDQSHWRELGNKKPGLKAQVIVEGEGVVMVLSDSYHGGASVKELELKEFVKVIALKVKLTADEGAIGTAVDKDGEDLGQAVKSDIDDKQLHGP